MPIYETFLQHVIASLSDRGKAAVVVPTGFTTATGSIPKKIRQYLIDKNWLRGVIHMPSNIFATTGTSVSIIFIDKTRTNEKVMLMDASNLGKKITLEDGQRTILSPEEKDKIISYFKECKEEPEFSVLVSVDDIKENDYSIQAGQYVELKDEVLDFDVEERLNYLKIKIKEQFELSDKLTSSILQSFESEV